MVCSHLQSRVESSRIKLTKTWQKLFCFKWQQPRTGRWPHQQDQEAAPQTCTIKSLDAASFIAGSWVPVTGRDSCYCALRN